MAAKSFEDKMKELEGLIENLESGAVPLKEMVSLYDKGMNLYAQCDRELKDFEERLKKLEQEA